MYPKPLLRVEGVVVALLAGATYYAFDGPLWLFVVLALAPDVSMLGYLASTKLGSATYNLFHTYTVSIAVGALGVWLASPLTVWVALVWTVHIGLDRALGYGLKYPTTFGDSHLSRLAFTTIGGSRTSDGGRDVDAEVDIGVN